MHRGVVHATDLSDEMLAVARKKLPSFSNVRLEKADCFNLPYENNSFDTVFMANLLHIIPEPENAVTEATRVLKDNGRLIALSFTTEGMTFLNKLKMGYRYLRTYGKPPADGQQLTVEGARMMMESRSLTVITAELIGHNVKAVFVIARGNGEV
ncbi:class I SAM-dependent methyltransferase [Methanolobus psychrotolerans]|uniref:class I SAM-dependent methyltransferase n=1 Tax=Methanolobus psychrotolerans TaxID=1874706 RepID=UPI002413E0E4|nr:class I SAM-dependent methyltransferase [Methanolobus psychrotolerans]